MLCQDFDGEGLHQGPCHDATRVATNSRPWPLWCPTLVGFFLERLVLYSRWSEIFLLASPADTQLGPQF